MLSFISILNRIKIETQEQFLQKSRDIDLREVKLKENLARLDSDQASHRKLLQEIEDYKNLISQLRVLCKLVILKLIVIE